jgi:hypothetical protein
MASELCVEDPVMAALGDLLCKMEVVDEAAAVGGCRSR